MEGCGGGQRLEDFVTDETGKMREGEAAAEDGNILQQPCTWRPRARSRAAASPSTSPTPRCMTRASPDQPGASTPVQGEGRAAGPRQTQCRQPQRWAWKFVTIGRRHPQPLHFGDQSARGPLTPGPLSTDQSQAELHGVPNYRNSFRCFNHCFLT